MSDTQEKVVAGSAPQDAQVGDTPAVPTAFDQMAAQASAKLLEVAAIIPAFEPRRSETTQFVKKYSTFSNESIRSMIAAIDAHPIVNSANIFDVGKARATLQYLDAFRPFVDQAGQFETDLRFSYFLTKARAVEEVLMTYQMMKGLGRASKAAGVDAHAKIIKRDLRRARVKAVKPTTPDPQPKVK